MAPESVPSPPDRDDALPPVPSTILLVDDAPSMASALARLLRRDGHTVETAANGRLALAMLQERSYDLILSDLRMPELDGPGLYRALQAHYPHLCRRFVVLTGDTLNAEALTFVTESGVPWLIKPFTAATVRGALPQASRAC